MSSSKFFQSKPKRQRILSDREENDNIVEVPIITEIQKEESETSARKTVSIEIPKNSSSSTEVEAIVKENVNMQKIIESKVKDIVETADYESPPEKSEETGSAAVDETTTTIAKKNPFACFAYSSTELLPPKENRPKKWSTLSSLTQKKSKQPFKDNSFIKMKDLVCEEQIRITKKWHSLADPNASLEVRRFQVLVATRLHARCQESSVRKAMNALGGLMGDFTVDSIAEADPQILAKCITNVQYYNAKAQQIVKAAREIKTQYGGEVPEDEVSLLKITGVGKVFADLLAFVNTRAAYKYTQTNQNKITPETTSRNPPAHIVTREV